MIEEVVIDKRSDDQSNWDGVERRDGDDRRCGMDRREEIRFELNKKDRRKSLGRRPNDADPWKQPVD